ncbi:hypothetical protein L0Y46_02000, partial [bacterium]|nr:hypothetical protein [bacterium]
MKLLVITQKVNKDDSTFGFFHEWIAEFARRAERVTVIALEVGPHSLPLNARVFSLGKERGRSRVIYVVRLFAYLFRFRNDYDAVFVHMNQIYVVLAGLWWRFMGKKIGLWYTHRAVSFSLRIAEKLAHEIFTVSKEGFNVPTKKLHIMGHGLNTARFTSPKEFKRSGGKFTIVSVGRITPIKNLDVLIDVAKILR